MCYRRSDSEERWCGSHIRKVLAKEFGKDAIFRDIDNIPPGVDFPSYIQNSLRDCPVALVFIPDGIGLHAPIVVVVPVFMILPTTFELRSRPCLALPLARVIPVLVRHAVLPSAEEKPDSLRPLRRRNAIVVRGAGLDFKNDINHPNPSLEGRC